MAQLALFESVRSRLIPFEELCAAPGCNCRVRARGLCRKHCDQKKLYGTSAPGDRRKKKHAGVTYVNAHDVVRRLWGPAKNYPCVQCGGPAYEWAYDGTDPCQGYGPNSNRTSWHFYSIWPEFYMPMCRACHVRRDGEKVRLELHEYRLAKHKSDVVNWQLAQPH